MEFPLAKVVIYTTPICGYCTRAKALLDKKGVVYEDINVMMNKSKRQEMVQRTGRKPLAAAMSCSNWISTVI